MKTIILFLVSLIAFSQNLQSQWQPDVRLTNDPSQSYMSNPNKHCIASNGNTLHVVWHDQRSNWDIYYKRSTDAGLSWTPDTRLSNGSGESHEAGIAVSGSFVHVVWHDNRDGHWEIYYIHSTDNGLSWSGETRISTLDTFQSNTSSLNTSGSNVHVVWMDERDGNFEIYYIRSTNNGTSWSQETRLTNNSAVSLYPSINLSGSNVHVVWFDDRDGNYEIYYKRSSDGGLSWGSDTRLSDIPNISELATLAVSGNFIHVVWQDERDGNDEIYYKRSTNAGLNWSIDTRLTTNSGYSAAPNITISDPNVHITWQDDRDGNHEIYYKRSTDYGITWTSDTRLTNSSGTSVRSFSTVTGSALHVLWMDDRVGNWEIFYKTDPTGNPLPPLVPLPPVLISPVNGAINQPTTMRFFWNKSQYASSYRFQLALDSLFNNIVVDDSTFTDSTALVVNLLNNTTYWWRVNAKNSVGTSPFSAVWHFRTFLAVPSAPVLISPVNGAIGQSLTPTLVWSGVSGAVTYKAQVSNDSLFSSTLLDSAGIPFTQVVVPAGRLLNNHRYYWRVNATNAAGTGPWSVVFHFNTLLIGFDPVGSGIPKEYTLYTNYPNPFNPVTKIKIDIPEITVTKLSVYDILGRELASLVNEKLSPGTYEVEWDGSNYPSGVYFYKLESRQVVSPTGDFTQTKKMVLIK